MKLTILPLRKALNKAYLKEKVSRSAMEEFKQNLKEFLASIKEKETEEYAKNNITTFLKDTYYIGKNQINTKGRIDLAIYENDNPVVLMEAKHPTSPEMLTKDDVNKKALHELILYYLREREEHKNDDIKYLIATNLYQWFIFEGRQFEKLFFENKTFLKQYTDWKGGRKASTDTTFFYNHIAKPFLEKSVESMTFTWFDLQEIQPILAKEDSRDDNKLVAIYKILSPPHLLKLPFRNDSNTLDRGFYNELLHIIGLEEVKEKGKKLIQRKSEPDPGSLLENAITMITSEDQLRNVSNISHFGNNSDEQLFNVALELCLTWINRVLFLKLLEGQLLTYHKGDQSYRFLDFKTVPQFDELNKLFFQVLAQKPNERTAAIRQKYGHVPYLNSALFDVSALEDDTIRISNLDDSLELPLYSKTVLADAKGKRKTGSLLTLHYLLEFLDAYDFSSEGIEEIQEENKTLINASVLGLIFEKINGYKDGSYFTPGFITMYMCRETIRRAVVQKFNERYTIDCENLDDLKNYVARNFKVKEILEFNAVVNGLKICDPAVGSGHFLVSSLNEIIAIKSELGILADGKGGLLAGIKVEVQNDELIVTDAQDNPVEYSPGNQESQRLQEALFHEKETIIENCLFGVDINRNSVKICRLRLWIELLKNAYYTKDSKYTDLETLPNIDINIKQGNSLISRFELDEDLAKPLKKVKYTIEDYRQFVNDYKHATDRDEKHEFIDLIDQIKSDFRTEIHKNDPKVKRKSKLAGELFNLENQVLAFEPTAKEKKDRESKKQKLQKDIKKLSDEIDAIEKNVIYKEAFEWRFEFPEVLDQEGNFTGFDVVIGNPPYYQIQKMDKIIQGTKGTFKTYEQTGDIYALFYEEGHRLLKANGVLSFISSNKWMRAKYGVSLRKFFMQNTRLLMLVDFNYFKVFDEASVDTCILLFSPGRSNSILTAVLVADTFDIDNIAAYVDRFGSVLTNISADYWNIIPRERLLIKSKIQGSGIKLKHWDLVLNYGIKTGLNKAFIIDKKKKENLVKQDPKSIEIIKPYLRGRDIRKYGLCHDKLWIINSHNGLKATDLARIDVKSDYPAVYEHLLNFESEAKSRRDQGDHWTNLRNCAYLEDFEKEKLIYAETMRIHKSDQSNFPRFGYDNGGYMSDKTTFIATGKHLKFVLGVLNSRMGAYLIKEYVTKLDTGGYMMQKVFLGEIPIPKPPRGNIIEKLVTQILKTKKKNAKLDTSILESEIDQMVYELYGLTEEEIKIVEGG